MGRIDWHAGFLAAMKLELMEDEDNLEFLEEQFLDGRKQRYDLLIIKNDRSVKISNEIGLTNKADIGHLDSIVESSRTLDAKHKGYAEEVMDVFVRANTKLMGKVKKEGGHMCRAVNELFADEINEMKAVIAAKDEQLADKDEQLADKDEQLADKDVQLADKDVQIRTLTDRVAQLEKRAITTVL